MRSLLLEGVVISANCWEYALSHLQGNGIEGGLPRRCHFFTSEETDVSEQQSLFGIRDEEVASVKLLCQRNGSDFPFGADA